MNETNNRTVLDGAELFQGVQSELWLKCKAELRKDDNGKNTVHFRIRVKRISVDRKKEILKATNANDMSDDDVANELLVDWDLKGKNGQALEFSPEHLDALMQIDEYRKAVVDALLTFFMNFDLVKAGNARTRGTSTH